MQIVKNFSLAQYNTFGFEVYAKYFARFKNLTELIEILQWKKNNSIFKMLILGGGSNVLFANDYDGLILKNEYEGINITSQDDDFVYIQVGAGQNWHEFVQYCVSQNWGGLENLSLIPGNVGASPIQNIGAYGVEIKDVFHALTAYNLENNGIEIFMHKNCHFGYRESVFKNEFKDKYIILDVIFRLTKQPKFSIEYGAIADTLKANGVAEISLKRVSEAVIQIRQSKLPNPAEIGNAGSFFKNPEIEKQLFEKLVLNYPAMPNYPTTAGFVKIPAGWLIEKAGWKGFKKGNVGVHEKQALVLVNYGGGNGRQMIELSQQIQKSILKKFGIELQTEVNFIF